MTITTTAKARATAPSRSRRVSSARAHREYDQSSAAQELLQATPMDEDLDLDTSTDDSQAVDRKKRETAQRKLVLENHPWVSKNSEDFNPKSVRCVGCNKVIQLDKRWEYYTTAWDKHVFRCARIKASYFEKGQDMPFESLVRLTIDFVDQLVDRVIQVAEVGRDAAEKCRNERAEARATGIDLQLTSDPTWVKPVRIAKARKISKLTVSRKPLSSGSSVPSLAASPSSRAASPRIISSPSTSSLSSRSASVSSPSTWSSTSASEVADVDDVPYHETLAYQIGLALPRIAASHGYSYCCGALQKNPGAHELAHQMGYI
ncbi:hypothetical protein GGU11DRAFT_810946 [Lentinula aff. detonsa]|uniref:Uncharacterized protein n=1 Tax=Lentinula aff. detonsa TaxID=2804958 RepID=A0AA38L2E8_9AGAR|nr:hypothetical protein GGU10DRAFT_409974 [Lentinula aff. detonsa]KAJ3794832.1 hypothetical protein GGU11DRAFT_810946 [Lentinula aff. detonsa]